MTYVDGFIIAVPTANKQAFIEHARTFDPMFMEFGAVRIVEGWGDDVPEGKADRFPPCGAGQGPTRRSCFPGSSGRTRRRAMRV